VSNSARTSAQPAFGLQLPDRYRVKRHVATGGMASVWCAEDRVLGRSVAIKVLSDRFADDEDAVRRFMREARAAARVSNHPHVVTIYDVGDIAPAGDEPSPRAFIVMEFLAGGTVADALRVGAVRSQEARRWVSEAASALDHAHQRGIVHRDIKPANFLLDRSRRLHVADFGIAHLQSEDTITSTGQLFGTAAYLAPEQALGKEATGASDRYALAIAAFELLTGGRPFTASHFAAQARQHIEDEPPRASEREPSLPPALDAVLARGMAKDPDERYPTARAFTEELDHALDSTPTAATAPLIARTEPLRPAGQRRPSPAALRPSTTAQRRTTPRRSGRAVALTALAIVLLGVIALISQLSSGPGRPAHRGATLATTHTKAGTHKPAARKPAAASSSSTTASSSSTTAAVASTTTTPTGADALNAQGYQEMQAGQYPQAIPTLEKAVATAPHASITYAYALYNLGRSLFLSGNPQAAIPVLRQRLAIPNQTPVVQALLSQAEQAAGQPSGGAGLPGKGHGKGPGHGHGGGG
jgi:serine/threonine-protein kinase